MANSKTAKIHILLLWILVITLFVCQLIRVEPTIEWKEEGTFIGVIVSLMALTMAIIIGYQAISAYDIKSELKECQHEIINFKRKINTLEKANSALQTHTKQILDSSQENVSILNALLVEEKDVKTGCLDAFNSMHQALYFALGSKSNNIEFIMNKLRYYGEMINTTVLEQLNVYDGGMLVFSGESKWENLKEKVSINVLPDIKKQEALIVEHDHFSSISHEYKSIMQQVYERIDLCSSRYFPVNNDELMLKFK